jgi:hypothetical protein
VDKPALKFGDKLQVLVDGEWREAMVEAIGKSGAIYVSWVGDERRAVQSLPATAVYQVVEAKPEVPVEAAWGYPGEAKEEVEDNQSGEGDEVFLMDQ